MADFPTAFVYLHAQAGPDFFADVPYAWTAGELRKLGYLADVFHVHFERDRPQLQHQLIEELVERVRTGGYKLVVLEHCWLPSIITRLQTETPAWVCETEPDAVLVDANPDFVLHHFTNHRQPLIDLVVALADGAKPDECTPALTNLVHHGRDGNSFRSATFQLYPPTPDATRPFCPVVERITLGTPVDLRGQQHPVRKTLDTNKGCPFSADVRKNPMFSGFSLDSDDVTLHGCAFCPMGGDYKALPWRDTVSIHLDHIAWYQQHLPRLDEIVLRDQHAIRYIPALLQGAIDRGLKPFGLLVPGRGDAILRFGEQMREATKVAGKTGFWWTIYLVGFESFSQPQLDLYNKGVTVQEYAQALVQMRALHREHPNAFRLYAAGASSFILFSPWTTLDDLRANVDFCRENNVWRLARGLTTTRMRLYPNLPLYHKAKADGLLDDSALHEDRGAAHTGYAAEAGWRYLHPEVAVVEDLHERLRRHCQVDELVGLLDVCERYVRSVGPDWRTIDIDALEQRWVALRSLWRKPAERRTHQTPGQRQLAAKRIDEQAARTVLAGRSCNNRCQTCVADHAQHDDDATRLSSAVKLAARGGRVTFAGREPLLLPELLRHVRVSRQATDSVDVELVTNGRLLCVPGVAKKLQAAGVTRLLIKRHRLLNEDEDRFCQANGAGQQMWAGIAQLQQEAPAISWRLLLVVARDGLGELAELRGKALRQGADGIVLKVMAAEVELDALDHFLSEISAFSRRPGVELEGF